MAQYNNINTKFSNLQLCKLKSGMQNGTEVTVNLLSNVIADSNYETVAPKLLLTDRSVSRFCKAFVSNSSANIKLSKTQLSKMVHLGGFMSLLDQLWIMKCWYCNIIW